MAFINLDFKDSFVTDFKHFNLRYNYSKIFCHVFLPQHQRTYEGFVKALTFSKKMQVLEMAQSLFLFNAA